MERRQSTHLGISCVLKPFGHVAPKRIFSGFTLDLKHSTKALATPLFE